MKASPSLWLGIGLIGSAFAVSAAPIKITPEQSDFFEKKIRPILSQHCYKCHSEAEKVKGGLLVDSRDALRKGGDSGPGVVPGKPDKSLIIKAVRYEDKDLAMPPKGEKLSDDEIEALVNWVKMGAPDPREAKSAAASGPKVDIEKAKQHWAFKPVAAPEVPKVKDTAKWVKSPIDSFVLAKLQEKGLQPSPAADKRTLIRRATYDLTGLPPTPEEVDAFLADKSKDAFAKVVDRLLASPRYGEHWGRHWLDIARYADTSGDRLGGNRKSPLYPHAWTYRDYVIKAFNNDLPYDQFVVQQIAGDRLPEAEKDKSITAAVGFLTVGKGFMNNDNDILDDRIDVVTKGLMGLTASCARCHDHKFDPIPTKDYYSLHGIFANSREPKEQPIIVDPQGSAEYQEYLKQMAKVEEEVAEYQKSEAARIIGGLLDRSGEYMMLVHDEIKPGKRAAEVRLLAKKRNLDGYMFEVWADTLKKISGKNDPIFTPWFRYAALGQADFAAKAPEITKDLDDSKLDVAVNPVIAKAIVATNPKTLKDVADVYTKLMAEVQKTVGAEPFDYRKVSDKRRGKGIDTAARMADQDMDAIRQFFFAESSPIDMDARQMNRLLGNGFSTRENAIRSQAVQLEMTHPGSPIRAMALQDSPRPKDSRIMIRGEARNLGAVAPRQFLEILSDEKREPFKDGSGRLELAKSIASRDNPLTARVYVNRVWKEHFGEAIVRTPSDFGMRSEPPTHPEMLDYLATTFMDNGWSIKKLHRQIMLSSTYQQDSRSTEKGLAVDPTNQWLWRMNIRRLGFESIRDTYLTVGGTIDLTMGGRPVNLAENSDKSYARRAGTGGLNLPEGGNRRTVYGMVDRAALPEMYKTFDFANPDLSSGERYLTTVPQQALFMMNSPFVVDSVRDLLARPEIKAATTDSDKVKTIYRLALQRNPSDRELEISLKYLASQNEENAAAPASQAKAVLPERPSKEAIAKMTPAERKAAAEAYRNAIPAAKPKDTRTLNTWERYTQTVVLANEFIYVN